ncbi:Rv3235 family protein [Streptomyces sp. NPDC049541]|uniref:Rv3235 family protein n=1 Tax=Streptomyces sp. NPDC049541 TaxID=3365594 RepID=UPI0037A7166C
MHKIMTRAQHQPGARPPGRRDSRRPGGAPPRTPGGTPTRTAPGGGRPPGSRTEALSPSTRPADNRPPTAPAATARNTTGALTGPGRPPGTATPPKDTTTRHAHTAPAARTTLAPSSTAPAPEETACPTGHTRPIPQPRPTDVFADLLLAVLSGQRPVHSMLRHTAGRAYDELAWLAERGPLRTRGTRPVVRDIGYYEARPGAVEAFARIGAGDQLRAMAFRLERGQDLRWRCTAVELGGPRPPRPTGDD